MLEADGVTVRRGGRAIVDDVSFSSGKEGLVAIIGPNGAGKSTLLSVFAGLLRPDAGAVRFNGAPLAEIDRKALATKRAYLPQNARCEWPIATEKLVALGLTPTLPVIGDLSIGDAARVEAALAAHDLEAQRTQSATTLSGGELARSMLARALVGDPPLLIADEPVAGLDPRHALDAMRRLRARADAGKLVIIALHDLAFAARFADRVVALGNGRVVVDGPPEVVLTAETLESLFGLAARIDRDEDGVALRYLD